jgi:integrase
LTWIGVVLRAARSVDGVAVRPEVVEEARTACRELRLIGKARRRDRRPTAAELARLKDYFMRSDNRRSTIPMCDIIEFAIQPARRQAEICRIEWADNDPRGRMGVVRDAKHPRAKDGNHQRFKYTPETWAIVERQPRTSEYIFPFDPNSVGALFTRACDVLKA